VLDKVIGRRNLLLISLTMAVPVESRNDGGTETSTGARDEIFWTELEFRRLGNIVAEMIHARRYVGSRSSDVNRVNSDPARAERILLRKRIDSMRRKALRILCRAELYADSGLTTWPGLDKDLTEPVSLAEEYVRTVSNYDAVLLEEEEMAERAMDEVDIGGAEPKVDPFDHERKTGFDGRRGSTHDIEIERTVKSATGTISHADHDDISYRDAIAREARAGDRPERDQLLSGGLRKRREAEAGHAGSASGVFSATDEELMARHQPIEDQLTSEMIDLVGRLKENVTEINAKIVQDGTVVDETEDAVDKNLSSIGKQRTKLATYTRSNFRSWWSIWLLVITIVIVFATLLILIKIPF
jgi:Membrane fusion protein Use1